MGEASKLVTQFSFLLYCERLAAFAAGCADGLCPLQWWFEGCVCPICMEPACAVLECTDGTLGFALFY